MYKYILRRSSAALGINGMLMGNGESLYVSREGFFWCRIHSMRRIALRGLLLFLPKTHTQRKFHSLKRIPPPFPPSHLLCSVGQTAMSKHRPIHYSIVVKGARFHCMKKKRRVYSLLLWRGRVWHKKGASGL